MSSASQLIVGALFFTVICLRNPDCCAADINAGVHAVSDATGGFTDDSRATSTPAGVTDIVTSVTASSPSSTVPTTTIVSDVTTTYASVTSGDGSLVSTTGCGTTKGCMHYPEGCHSPGNCAYVLTWSTTEPGFVDFELMAPSAGWVGVGLSTDGSMVGKRFDLCL